MVTTLTERRHDGGFLVSEEPGTRSRENIVLDNTSGAEIFVEAGTVLAKKRFGTVTATKASGTGDGTITPASPAVGPQAQVGTYVLTCIAAASNAGTFSVRAPDGTRLADLTVGVAYDSDHIKLTVADGAADWGAGAVINVVVPAGNGRYVPFTNAADLPAAAILFGGRTVPANGTAKAVSVERAAEVNASELVFDASLSGTPLTNAKAAAVTHLASAGIIQR